jgi:cytochrome c peroxidase
MSRVCDLFHARADAVPRNAGARQALLRGALQRLPRGTDLLGAGWNLHTARELGIDEFQANRSPTRAYRTAPLQGLWTHMKGGFYHDGRFATLQAVVEHYDRVLGLNLSAQQQRDLIEYLKSL